MTPISVAVEGRLDEAVLRRLLRHVGADVGRVFGRRGKPYLRARIRQFNQAASYSPWVVLADLDADEECAPLFVRSWLSSPARLMCFRVAVREVEAWLLADREESARFLGVPITLVPADPDSVKDPKAAMIALATRSRRREIREGLVPTPTSGRSVGPAYDDLLSEFVQTEWRPVVAARSSDSLRRCLDALRRLREGLR